jgi:glutamate mutase epsilon subunit
MFNIPEKLKSDLNRETLQRIAQENIDKAMSTPAVGVRTIDIFAGLHGNLSGDTAASEAAQRIQEQAILDFKAKGYEVITMRGMWCFGVR